MTDPAANLTEIPSTLIAGILGAVGVVVVVLIIATVVVLVMIALRKRRQKTPAKYALKVKTLVQPNIVYSHAHCNDYKLYLLITACVFIRLHTWNLTVF